MKIPYKFDHYPRWIKAALTLHPELKKIRRLRLAVFKELLELASRFGDEFERKHKDIANHTGVCRQTVGKHILRLHIEGWLLRYIPGRYTSHPSLFVINREKLKRIYEEVKTNIKPVNGGKRVKNINAVVTQKSVNNISECVKNISESVKDFNNKDTDKDTDMDKEAKIYKQQYLLDVLIKQIGINRVREMIERKEIILENGVVLPEAAYTV
jgi:DNA-binding MarR family transcriptional regulator